jgi:SAM-dependent methyltransferase
MFRTRCLVCGSRRLVGIIDLGIQPFADSFIPKDKLSEPDPAYPLTCDLCNACGHVQTSCQTAPAERYFALHNYSYTSSNSAFARRHWTDYATVVAKTVRLPAKSRIVEVGSNDGFLAAQFQRHGFDVLGIDASPYMANLAKRRRVRTTVGLFGEAFAGEVRATHGRAALIVANNVFNHADAPHDFVAGVVALLRPGGWFVFEQPYWLTSVRSERLDQVYHEHVSYFTVTSAARLLARHGFGIVDAEEVDYHGGSLRIYARRLPGTTPRARVGALIEQERRAGLFDRKTYRTLMVRALHRRNAFLERLYQLKQAGHPIIAVGAPAKGNTFLNFYRLDKSVIDYVTDSSPHKQGKYTPLTRIPIVGDEIFKRLRAPVALVLSWNLAETLRPKLHKINPRIQFISPEAAPE